MTSVTALTTNGGDSVHGNMVLVPIYNESFPAQFGWIKKMVELKVIYETITIYYPANKVHLIFDIINVIDTFLE